MKKITFLVTLFICSSSLLYVACKKSSDIGYEDFSFLKGWLKQNGGAIRNGTMILKSDRNAATVFLDWNRVMVRHTNNNDFFEVPFSNRSKLENGTAVMDVAMQNNFSIIFQKNNDGKIVARIKQTVKNNTQLAQQNNTEQFLSTD
jgi:hypothetical protein